MSLYPLTCCEHVAVLHRWVHFTRATRFSEMMQLLTSPFKAGGDLRFSKHVAPKGRLYFQRISILHDFEFAVLSLMLDPQAHRKRDIATGWDVLGKLLQLKGDLRGFWGSPLQE